MSSPEPRITLRRKLNGVVYILDELWIDPEAVPSTRRQYWYQYISMSIIKAAPLLQRSLSDGGRVTASPNLSLREVGGILRPKGESNVV